MHLNIAKIDIFFNRNKLFVAWYAVVLPIVGGLILISLLFLLMNSKKTPNIEKKEEKLIDLDNTEGKTPEIKKTKSRDKQSAKNKFSSKNLSQSVNKSPAPSSNNRNINDSFNKNANKINNQPIQNNNEINQNNGNISENINGVDKKKLAKAKPNFKTKLPKQPKIVIKPHINEKININVFNCKDTEFESLSQFQAKFQKQELKPPSKDVEGLFTQKELDSFLKKNKDKDVDHYINTKNWAQIEREHFITSNTTFEFKIDGWEKDLPITISYKTEEDEITNTANYIINACHHDALLALLIISELDKILFKNNRDHSGKQTYDNSKEFRTLYISIFEIINELPEKSLQMLENLRNAEAITPKTYNTCKNAVKQHSEEIKQKCLQLLQKGKFTLNAKDYHLFSPIVSQQQGNVKGRFLQYNSYFNNTIVHNGKEVKKHSFADGPTISNSKFDQKLQFDLINAVHIKNLKGIITAQYKNLFLDAKINIPYPEIDNEAQLKKDLNDCEKYLHKFNKKDLIKIKKKTNKLLKKVKNNIEIGIDLDTSNAI